MKQKRMSFAEACSIFVHRYTMEHVPAWSQRTPRMDGCELPDSDKYYAPQYRSDREWYENTVFPGDTGYTGPGSRSQCCSTGATWPLGQWLDKPYRRA